MDAAGLQGFVALLGDLAAWPAPGSYAWLTS